MNKKISIKTKVLMVLFVFGLLCGNGIFNIGINKVYAETDKTGEWEYWEWDNKVLITGYNGKKKIIVIPSKINGYPVTTIDIFAFSGRSDLKSITIPESVTHIYGNAFEGCSGLKSITIPKNVKHIGDSVFAGCSSLEKITVNKNNKVYDSRNKCNAIIEKSSKTLIAGCKNTIIPKGIKKIGATAFYECRGLKNITISQSVINIDEYAFYGCSSLKSITIPKNVKHIGDSVFAGCSSLEKITVNKNNKVYDSRNKCNAIIKKSSKTLVAGCKNTVIPKGITKIGGGAFSGCRGLKSITIPQSVTRIDMGAFSECSNLKSITIPKSVTSIDVAAFAGCSNLKSITIPESVTSIENETFVGCSNLKSITIPESVTSITYGAFKDCKKVKIRCKKNSVAHKFAKECGIKYTIL